MNVISQFAQSVLDSFREDAGVVESSTNLTLQSKDKPWQLNENPHFKRHVKEWEFVEMHYTGEVLHNLPDFLHQRIGAESNERYKERQKTVGYPQLVGKMIDSFVGIFSTFEDETKRQTSPEADTPGPLGKFDDPDTPMGKFALNVDGEGTSYDTYWLRYATELCKYGECWMLVDGVLRDEETGDTLSEPRYLIVPPQAVLNWVLDERGRISEVVTKTMVDQRTTLMNADEDFLRTKYTWYTYEGAQDFFIESKNQSYEIEIGAFSPYAFVDRMGFPMLPIFRTSMSLKRNPAWMAAIENNVIFNQMSERDFLLRMAALMRFAIVAGDAKAFKSIIDNLKKYGIIQHDPEQKERHYFIQPMIDAANSLDVQIERRVEMYRETTMQNFGDAVQKTATQIRGESKSGVEAYLEHLAAAITVTERGAAWRFEQVSLSNSNDWGNLTVDRPQRFSSLTSDSELEDMMDRLFTPSEMLPAGEDARLEAIQRWLRKRNLKVNDAQIKAEIAAFAARRGQEADIMGENGLFADISLPQ